MSEDLFKEPVAAERLERDPLAAHVDSFGRSLVDLGLCELQRQGQEAPLDASASRRPGHAPCLASAAACPTRRPGLPSIRGGTLSRDAVEWLVVKHTRTAQQHCPSLKRKRVTPHVLRHTAAMELLLHGVDRSVIALWLGHESIETTEIYLHADMRLKEKALACTTPLGT